MAARRRKPALPAGVTDLAAFRKAKTAKAKAEEDRRDERLNLAWKLLGKFFDILKEPDERIRLHLLADAMSAAMDRKTT